MRKLQILLPMLLMASITFAQQKIMRGKIISKISRSPIEGATVNAGSKTVSTDKSGSFSIEAAVGTNIIFTYIGMKSMNVKVTGGTQDISLEMEESVNDLNEIVVTGYKTERKKDLTGAVSVVNLNNIKNVPLASPMLALQGQVPGLYIQADGSPKGSNGNKPPIVIRGVNNLNSLGNANPPLYVIDGVPTIQYEAFANLNQNSIASIQVLKDASAASIYGSRAANGVIIVTTKNGNTSGTDKVRIQLTSSLTSQTEKPWQEDVLSTTGRGEALWRAAVNDQLDPNGISTNKIYTYDWNGDFSNPVLNKVNVAPYVGGSLLEPVGSTNWQNELYRRALVTSTDLAVSAGNGKSGFVLDLGYFNNDGLIKYTKFQRYNARINSHTSAFNARVRFGENFQLSRTSQIGAGVDAGNVFSQDLALTLAPTIPVFKTDGTYGGAIGAGFSDRNNPISVQFLNRWNTTNQFITTGNIFAEIEPIKNLVYRTSLGFDYTDGLAKVIKQIGTEGPLLGVNSLELQQGKEFTFTWTNTLAYNLTKGKHLLNLLAGIESVKNDFTTFGGANTNFAIQDVNYFQLSSGSGAQTSNGSTTGYRLLSQFGKVFYSYNDRYLATVTVRRDGSSRFGTNNAYGTFPAFTVGWRISSEDFFKNIDVVSNLKLRAGVGTVGNQQIGNLAAYDLYYANYGTSASTFPEWLNNGTAYDLLGVNTGTLPSGFVQTQRGNANLKWESTEETNVGLDFGFMNEKISGSFDYFLRKTSNILIQPPVAAVVGEGQSVFVNGATKKTKGWEFIIGYRDNTISSFGYAVTINGTHWKDVITELPENVRAAYPGDPAHSIIGHSQFSIFGYETDGIFQTQEEVNKAPAQPGAEPGRLKYKDLNGDNKINVLDQTWLGTRLPALEYGLRIEVSYKHFDLSAFGSGVTGKKGFDPVKSFNSFIDTRNNYGPGVLKAWTAQTPNSKIPALSILNRNDENRSSDFYAINASYFKLRNLQLGFNIPGKIAKIAKMESFRIYVSGQNLFAIKSKEFLSKDPERLGFVTWPVPTSYTVGINANF